MPLGEPKATTMNTPGNLDEFTEYMKRLVSVPYEKVQQRLEAERRGRKPPNEKPAVPRTSH